MKNVKFSLSNIEGKLSRVEMKQILGGCSSGGGCDRSVSEGTCASRGAGLKCKIDGSYYCCLRYQGDWQSCHK